MLKIKGWLRAAALCMAFCLLLTGCSIPMPEETVQVEELLRAPRLAGDYGALQIALNDWLGESAQLKYPLQGDLLSPFVLQDFDGDGELIGCRASNELINITLRLLKDGYKENDIAKIWGGNLLRVMSRVQSAYNG